MALYFIYKERINKTNKTMTAGEKYVGSDEIYQEVHHTMKLVAELNNGYKTEDEVREYLRKITNKDIDDTTRVFPPFNINYGKYNRKFKKSFFTKRMVIFSQKTY